ncbi:DoxX family protein [Janibacter terrae]|uniref:DoxX family protein n=1 Tax=Janibacter terrae TaxID=103817 RepID=UPI0008393F0C|nr:DoxX family protein [Janibacter terrae]
MRRTQIDLALVILRIVMGLTMFLHGWQKLTAAGFGGVGEMFAGMGAPLAGVTGPLTLLVELVGGVLIVLGLGTRVVGAVYALVMLGALFVVHLSAGFFVGDGGYELVLLLAGIGAALAVAGPGAWSLDAVLAGRRTVMQADAPERERVAA